MHGSVIALDYTRVAEMPSSAVETEELELCPHRPLCSITSQAGPCQESSATQDALTNPLAYCVATQAFNSASSVPATARRSSCVTPRQAH